MIIKKASVIEHLIILRVLLGEELLDHLVNELVFESRRQ